MTVPWRPHDDHHSVVEKANGDEPLFAILGPVVFPGKRVAGENLAASGKVQPALCKRSVAFRRVEMITIFVTTKIYNLQ